MKLASVCKISWKIHRKPQPTIRFQDGKGPAKSIKCVILFGKIIGLYFTCIIIFNVKFNEFKPPPFLAQIIWGAIKIDVCYSTCSLFDAP